MAARKAVTLLRSGHVVHLIPAGVTGSMHREGRGECRLCGGKFTVMGLLFKLNERYVRKASDRQIPDADIFCNGMYAEELIKSGLDD